MDELRAEVLEVELFTARANVSALLEEEGAQLPVVAREKREDADVELSPAVEQRLFDILLNNVSPGAGAVADDVADLL